MRKILILFLLFFASFSWGACSRSYNCFSFIVNISCPYSPAASQYEGTLNNGKMRVDCSFKRCYNSYSGSTTNCASNSCGGLADYCCHELTCSSQAEYDSVYCELYPDTDGCSTPCDSTKWECSTSVEHSQTTIASDNIECFGGDCFGGTYCEYVSTSTTTCTNECGQSTTQTSSVPIRYEGHCNDDNLTDDTECTNVRCMSFEQTQSYTLYKLCASREIVNGERVFFPRMVGGGKGTCKNAGYPESNGDSTSFSGNSSNDSLSVPESCFTMGINCPPPDTTNYNDNANRNADKCKCEKLDGMDYISTIICPDGSATAFYGSCDEWRAASQSSSSTPPEPSSSGSENPQSSSGGALVGDWTTYSQGEEIKGILGVIAMNTAKENQQTINNVNSVNIALDDYTASISDSAAPLVVPDSIYNPEYIIDTAGLKEAIFGRVTEENSILDTLLHPNSKCPCFTFFSGNGSSSTVSGNHLRFQQIQFDFSDFHGFDVCHIISVIVTALASVVAFFIGFAIFKNVS